VLGALGVETGVVAVTKTDLAPPPPLDLELGAAEVVLRASVGVAVDTAGEMGADELLQAADQAMYRVKERGKNGIYVADEPDGGKPIPVRAAAAREWGGVSRE
jgi:predicted signal transduction protein with EAL and GGDEF domain